MFSSSHIRNPILIEILFQDLKLSHQYLITVSEQSQFISIEPAFVCGSKCLGTLNFDER